jgi:HNH endonuclease/AP2 domain
MLTQERLRELLHYDPDTGIFTRLVSRPGYNGKVGDTVGTIGKGGYLACSIDNKFHQIHRLAWLYMYGNFPFYDIDHIDGVTTNNRIDNLRDVPTAINCGNTRKPRKNNKSGLMGVHWRESHKKWLTSIRINKKIVWRGSFDCPIEAEKAYIAAKRKFHDGFLL